VDYETRQAKDTEAKLLDAQARHMTAELALLKANTDDGYVALTMKGETETAKQAEALSIRSHELAMKRAEHYQLFTMWRTLFVVVGGVVSLWILATAIA
jgi:hypothetical protein